MKQKIFAEAEMRKFEEDERKRYQAMALILKSFDDRVHVTDGEVVRASVGVEGFATALQFDDV